MSTNSFKEVAERYDRERLEQDGPAKDTLMDYAKLLIKDKINVPMAIKFLKELSYLQEPVSTLLTEAYLVVKNYTEAKVTLQKVKKEFPERYLELEGLLEAELKSSVNRTRIAIFVVPVLIAGGLAVYIRYRNNE